jgi:hypothetical protein
VENLCYRHMHRLKDDIKVRLYTGFVLYRIRIKRWVHVNKSAERLSVSLQGLLAMMLVTWTARF